MEIRLAGAEFFRADRQADRHDETDSRFFFAISRTFFAVSRTFFLQFREHTVILNCRGKPITSYS